MVKENFKAGIFFEHTSQGVSQEGLVERVTGYIHKYDLDIFLGPEWLFVPSTRLYAPSEKEEIIGKIAEKTKDKDTLIIPGSIMWEDKEFFYNTAPLISKGQLIGENHKFFDGGDAGKARQRNCTNNFYNQKSDRIFKWKDYRIGIEICADRGMILNSLKESNAPLLDMYFLVSCGLTLYCQENIPIKKDGHALYSNGSSPNCAAFKKIEHEKNEELEAKNVLDNLWLYNLSQKNPDNPKKCSLEKIIKIFHKK